MSVLNCASLNLWFILCSHFSAMWLEAFRKSLKIRWRINGHNFWMVGRRGLNFCMRGAENPIYNFCFLHYFPRSTVSALEGSEIAENIRYSVTSLYQFWPRTKFCSERLGQWYILPWPWWRGNWKHYISMYIFCHL